MSREGRDAGFTLIEVLGVVAIISFVFFVALNFYIDLSRATARASEHTRGIRRATALIDRIARDFESATLVIKPPDVDPISHPWLFVAESQHSEIGADHIKFVTRNHDPTRTDNRESDLAVVAYTLRNDDDGGLALYRWSSPRLPESLDRSYPLEDDEGSFLMAEGLGAFGVRFIGEDGEPRDDWDSTTLEDSSLLPIAVDIELAMADERVDPNDPDGQRGTYQRRVLIPVRPLDFEQLLAAAASGADEEEIDPEDGEIGSRTVGDCVTLGSLVADNVVSGMWIAAFPSMTGLPFHAGFVDSIPADLRASVEIDPACLQ